MWSRETGSAVPSCVKDDLHAEHAGGIAELHSFPISKGEVASHRNCLEIRRLTFAEMSARAATSELPHLLRTSTAQSRVMSHQTQVTLTVSIMSSVAQYR